MRSSPTVAALALGLAFHAGAQGRPRDPVTMDQARDTVNPPRLAELVIQSGGQRLNALMYVASGAGPHPTVVLTHGNPGNERNLDLAQAMRRAGANVLYFNYRGSWGSGGTFSRANALGDVAAVLAFVRSPDAATRLGVDTSRVAIVGHSMGGWVALMGTAADPKVRCVAALDFTNVGSQARTLLADPKRDSATVAMNDGLVAPGGPYRAASGAALVAEIKAHATDWDLARHAAALRTRPILLISAINPEHQAEVVAALRAVNAPRLTALDWKTDHSYSDRRIELARTIIGWLQSSCGF